ncbi:MAG: hypothetical protein ABL308_15050 [Oceanicaulis sp.]
MAKAVFHKHQRVYVKPVGTWAAIEKVKPQWVKDVEEPVKIFYDCGLGRDFTAAELSAEQVEEADAGRWRLMRARNKWQSTDECAHHPQPGTYPVVVTDKQDWGGWRVPGAEYDRDPARIEHQARLIVHAPSLLALAETLAREAAENPDAGAAFVNLGKTAADLVRAVRARPETREPFAAAG